MIDRYCVDCHNDAELTGGVSFQRLKPENVVADARIWEAAIRKLRLGMMPPREEPQPELGGARVVRGCARVDARRRGGGTAVRGCANPCTG